MKKAIALIMALCMVFALCACSEQPQQPDTDGERSSITVSSAVDTSSFDPMASMSVGCMYNLQIFECLIREEVDGTLVPGLAESWEMSDDNMSVTFKIREGVKFHNGDTLLADDVAFSLNRVINEGNLDVTSYMEKAEVVDETHVKLTLKSVYSDILNSLAVVNLAIVSKSVVEDKGDAVNTEPVGTGPYILKNWVPGVSVTLTASPDYWRGEAAIKEVTILIQPNASTGAVALENNEVDALLSVLFSDEENLKATDNITVYSTSSISTYTLYLNCSGGATEDVRVRQAIALCLNREEYIQGAYNGNGTPASTIISPSMAYHNDSIKVPERNIEKAKELLADAGYPDGLSLKYATVAEDSRLVNLGAILKGHLAEAGIDLEVDVKEYSAWFSVVQGNHDFDITCAASTANISTTGSVLSNILTENAVNNLGLYKNDEVTELISKANETFDDSLKQGYFDRICEIVLDECPIIALFVSNTCLAANSDIQHVVCPAVTTMYFYDWAWKA